MSTFSSKPGGTKVGNFLRGAVKVAKTVFGKAGGLVSPANVISAFSKPKVTQYPTGTQVGKNFLNSSFIL